MFNSLEYIPTHVTAAGGTQVFIGKGRLHAVNVNTTAATPVYLYDGLSTSSSSALIAGLVASATPNQYKYDVTVANGLYVTNGAGDFTYTWTKG